MTPENPVVGGTVLRIPAIQSPNFVTEVSGWIIRQDGSAEFDNVIIRGTITAGTFEGTDFLIDSSGAFFYSGTPASGNPPIISVCNVSTDPFGNAVQPGVVSYDTATHSYTALYQGILDISIPGFAGQISLTATGQVELSGTGVLLNGPAQVTGKLTITAGGLAVTGGTTTDTLTVTGKLTATGGTAASPSQISTDTWHDIATAGFLNGWVNSGAPNVKAKYRLVASPPNSVEIIGNINANAATSATFFQLPAGYIPASQQPVALGANGDVTAGTSPFVNCDTSGNLSVQHVSTGVNIAYLFHGFISLDA